MDPLWKQGLPELEAEDVPFVKIIENQIQDLMTDYEDEGMLYPQARQIVRSAWNLRVVGEVIRAAVSDYMTNGRF